MITRTPHLLLLVVVLLYQKVSANGDNHDRKLLGVRAYGANPNFKLGRCEGDCDRDSDCLNGMICFQRGSNTPVPGCTGGGRDGSRSDYCIRRSDLGGSNPPPPTPTPPAPTPIAANSGNLPRIKWSTNFPLGLCQGDCDSDRDCQGNLVCHQRNKFQAVPGCRGGETNGSYTDYCVSRGGIAVATPVARPAPAPMRAPQGNGLGNPSYRFQLRLYWENGYTWQETRRETWWCMQCTRCNKFSLGDGPPAGCRTTGDTDSSCREGHNIWIRRCKDRSRDYQFNILKNPGSGDQVRVDGTNLCLSTVNNRYLELRNCDRSSSRQLWKPITNINKFELRPYHQRDWGLRDAKCLSQLHHPKDKELVGLHRCRTTKDHETMYWEEYHH